MLVLKIILVKGSFVKKTVYIYSFGNIFPPLFIFILCSLISKIYDMCIIKIEDGTIRFFKKRKKR